MKDIRNVRFGYFYMYNRCLRRIGYLHVRQLIAFLYRLSVCKAACRLPVGYLVILRGKIQLQNILKAWQRRRRLYRHSDSLISLESKKYIDLTVFD